MTIEWMLGVFVYAFIGGIYFRHNYDMGHWMPGLFAAVLWPVTGFLWCLGGIFVAMESMDMAKRIRK